MLTPTNHATFIASEAITAGARVKLVSGSGIRIELADAGDNEIGTAILHQGKSTYAAEDPVGVLLLGGSGTRTVIAASTFAAGATLKRADDGKVDDTGSGAEFGIAIEAATAANEPIEALWLPTYAKTRSVVVDSDGATLTAAQTGTIVSNLGASAAAAFNLPAATVGLEFIFVVEVAQELRINPDGTETVALPATGVQQAAGKYITADAIGERIHLVCISAGTWDALSHAGTWTVEA